MAFEEYWNESHILSIIAIVFFNAFIYRYLLIVNIFFANSSFCAIWLCG